MRLPARRIFNTVIIQYFTVCFDNFVVFIATGKEKPLLNKLSTHITNMVIQHSNAQKAHHVSINPLLSPAGATKSPSRAFKYAGYLTLPYSLPNSFSLQAGLSTSVQFTLLSFSSLSTHFNCHSTGDEISAFVQAIAE